MIDSKPTPPQDLLKERYDYNPDTGLFTYKIRVANCVQIGDEVGGYDSLGYRVCTIDRQMFKVHRIIWKWYYGEEPIHVDHIDNNPANNIISNLRSVSDIENWHNRTDTKKNGTLSISYYRQHNLPIPQEARDLYDEYMREWYQNKRTKGTQRHL